jgi:hypothetical protein
MSKRTIFYFASIPLCLLAIVLTYIFLWYTVTTTDASKAPHYRFKVTATVTATEHAEIPAPMDIKPFPSDC